MRPHARHPPRSRSQFQLIVISLFSACLLGSFLWHRAPSVGHHGAVETREDTSGAASRRELHINDQDGKGSAVTSVSQAVISNGAPDAPQGIVADPTPQVVVGAQDARHPDNVKLLISQQSAGDEQRSSLLETFIKGRFDAFTRKKKPAKTTTSTSTGLKSTTAGSTAKTTVAKNDQSGIKSTATKPATGTSKVEPTKSESKVVDSKATTTQSSTTTAAKTSTASTTAATGTTAAATTGTTTTGTKAAPTVEQYNGGTTTAAGPGCKSVHGFGCGLGGKYIHTVFTSNGSPYQNFQARIMIGTWKIVRAMPGGDHMRALTRVLHRTTPDELMEEVDTFRAEPLQPECDKWCWFPVADRANAFQQWLNAVEAKPSMLKGPWILLLETDYVWIKPLQPLGDAGDPTVPGLSFAFDYIGPKGNHVVEQMLRDECPTCDPDTVPNSGPAPVLARFDDFKAATPLWEKLSKWIETHEEAKKALGWVREMYAWDIGVAAGRLNIVNEPPPTSRLIAQPPHDLRPGNASMYHYTWGSIFKDNGTAIWKFDKRTYVDPKDALKVPRIPLPPPWRSGILLHDTMPITQELHSTLTHMLTLMNNAIDTLPDLTAHASAIKQRAAAALSATTKAAST